MFLATGIVDAIAAAVDAGLVTVATFVPALVGAVILLIAGWVVAGAANRLVTTLLTRTGFEGAAERAGVAGLLRHAGLRTRTAAGLMGLLTKWAIRLVFLEAAAGVLRLGPVTDVMNRLVLFIPNLVVALAVLLGGSLAGRFVGGIVRGTAAQAGFDNPRLIGTGVQYTITGFAAVVALEQVGIGASLVNLLFAALAGAVALAFGLAFGLGGREVAGQVWRTWHAQMQDAGAQLEASAMPAVPDVPARADSMRPPSSEPPRAPRRVPATAGPRMRQPGEGWRSDP